MLMFSGKEICHMRLYQTATPAKIFLCVLAFSSAQFLRRLRMRMCVEGRAQIGLDCSM